VPALGVFETKRFDYYFLFREKTKRRGIAFFPNDFVTELSRFVGKGVKIVFCFSYFIDPVRRG